MKNVFMSAALEEAKKAAAEGEVPVGAVIVRNGEIIAAGRNACEADGDPKLHAEMLAISRACEAVGGWRLSDCDIYVTLEPCLMCAGALLNARIRRIYFGAYDAKNGACGSVCDVGAMGFTHKPEIYGGIGQDECAAVLAGFFGQKR
ncbi:MAG: nucleoside deaminase [Clostridia bacterium]|nr:nucleoside deaminase [Clostridia bacterium]